MELFCEYCGKKIKFGGTVEDGKPFHNECFAEKQTKDNQEKINELIEKYSYMDFDVIKKLANDEELLGKLEDKRRPWAVVYNNDINELEIDNYAVKNIMLMALGEWVRDAAFDLAITVSVQYILYRGNIRYEADVLEDELKVDVRL